MTNNSVHNEQMKTTHNDDDGDEFSALVFRSNIHKIVYIESVRVYGCRLRFHCWLACMMYSACFVCVSANVCMCVRHRFFALYKHCVTVCSVELCCCCCSPGSRMHVCMRYKCI